VRQRLHPAGDQIRFFPIPPDEFDSPAHI